MTVSENAKNHRLFYNILFAILFCLSMFSTQNARAQITLNDTPGCIYLITITAGLTLSKFPRKVPNGYTIVRRSHPPAKIFKPGDTYQIHYAIGSKPSKLHNCMDIGTHDLTLAAQVHGPGTGEVSAQNASHLQGLPKGTESKPLSEAATIIGKVRINRFDYGTNKWFTANFTVPNMEGHVGKTEIYDLKMWVCPPNIKALGCHGHVISVRNQSTSGWKISRLTPRLRTLGYGTNPVPANRRIPLSATVSQLRGWANLPGEGPTAQLRQVYGPGGPVNATLSSQSVPPVGAANSTTMRFEVGPLTPGSYTYKACLTGLKDARGWPTPELCGKETILTVPHTTAQPTPPQPVAPVANNCIGGRIKNAQGRCVCPTGSFWNANPGFNRCYRCTGGRTWNKSAKRCACPSGTRWNQRIKRCSTAIPACTGGKVRKSNGTCACPTGLIDIRGNCARLQGVPTPQVTIPGLVKQPVIRCAGGTVTNNSCLCPRGFTRRTIKKNVYVCKPPLKRPVPGASQSRPNLSSSATTLQNQIKKPSKNKLQCLGGQVKGVLCWCGIGRFPKKIGNNVYRCQ